MGKVFAVFCVFLIFISACEPHKKNASDAPSLLLSPQQKSGVIGFGASSVMLPMPIDTFSFIEVNEWFDPNSILFLRDENETSYLQSYDFGTGEETPFFSVDEPIVQVTANEDHSLFAIQTVTMDYKSPLYIVSNEGNVIRELTEIGDDFSLYWNPYQTDELIIVSYLPNWDFEVLYLSIKDGSVRSLDIDQTFFQWIDEETVVFLDWHPYEPSYYAPLVEYNIRTGEQIQKLDEVIAVFSFGGHYYFTITIDSPDAQHSIYTFYQGNEEVGQFEVPVLNTYSQQWWIPFHDLHADTNMFYYLRPYFASDYFNYADGYELIQYNLEDGSETVLDGHLDQVPFKVSPSGHHILYGSRLETLFQLSQNKWINIIEE
ncbi:hypothetical protein [Bacillus alkalicellulosilyticus]|uniref:YqgU-like beta propeller domain-containing protein n=1 Tax=Alkalihalobacterium alkalicellulosilyticum TaxID=1912214 RepID=UPI0009969A18|nr:hypothetical protein [Bacillus alkalicellulosilyticus]